MLEELMAEFGVASEATLMIGDTSHDLLMAQNAGGSPLAVTYGAHPHDHLLEHSPLACLHTVAELEHGSGRTPDLRQRRPRRGGPGSASG
jgi:phosphoglycolate phosphatase